MLEFYQVASAGVEDVFIQDSGPCNHSFCRHHSPSPPGGEVYGLGTYRMIEDYNINAGNGTVYFFVHRQVRTSCW